MIQPKIQANDSESRRIGGQEDPVRPIGASDPPESREPDTAARRMSPAERSRQPKEIYDGSEVDYIKARILAILTIVFATSALLLLFQAPASAHHREDHGGGPSHQEQSDGDESSDDSDEGSTGEEGSSSDESSTSDESSGEEQSSSSGDGTQQEATSDDSDSATRSDPTDPRGTNTVRSSTSSQVSISGGGQGCDGSHGSDTGHGANTDGPDNPYHNTCDGSPSQNGNGGGMGTPCAGCVGNADDKFPPGQAPNASDHNNGYECDGNRGVGKTNPAHTGCKPPPAAPPPCCAVPPCCDEPPKPPRPPRPLPPDSVLPKPPIHRTPPRVVVTVVRPGPNPAVLPRTGSSALGLGATGLGLMLAGSALLTVADRRRRRTGFRG